MRRSLAQHCRQRFLVLDQSKFGRGATVRGGHIAEASAVFTDQPVPEAIAARLQDAGVRLVVWSEQHSTALPQQQARKSVVSGKRVSVSVDLGGRRSSKKKLQTV